MLIKRAVRKYRLFFFIKRWIKAGSGHFKRHKSLSNELQYLKRNSRFILYRNAQSDVVQKETADSAAYDSGKGVCEEKAKIKKGVSKKIGHSLFISEFHLIDYRLG